MGASIPGIDAMVFINQWLMPPLLGTEGSGDIHGTVHHLPALIVQTQHRRTFRNEGLLLHPRLRSQRSGYIMKISYFIPLVCGKSCFSFFQGHIFPQTRLKLKGVP